MNKNFVILLITFCAFSIFSYAQETDKIPAHDSLKIDSKILEEIRTINIWTPPSYSQEKNNFPVLYMPDGGIKEDFAHIANTLAELIEAKKIDPIILVGIENTERRRDLTGFTSVEEDKKVAKVVGGAEKFRAFIKDELIPEINKKYRTSNYKGIIGESLAGLFVTETFFTTPSLFDFYITFDPSVWWNNHELVTNARNYLAKFPQENKRFWFAGSGAKDILKYTKSLSQSLKSANLPMLKWNYSEELNEKHNTIFRASKEKALIWTLSQEK